MFYIIAPVLGILSGIVALLAYPPYIRDMLKGITKPERVSWLIWSVLSVIALTSQIAAGAQWSIIMTLAQTIGVVTVFLLSFKYGYGSLKRRDIISLITAGVGLIGWLVTGQSFVALLFVIIVDFAGAWLTVYKAYKDPESETLVTWQLDTVSGMLGLLAVGSINFTLMLYPAYLLIANGSVVGAIYLARVKAKKLTN